MGELFVVCALHLPCHMQVEHSGVAHLEFSVLHVLTEAVAVDAGLSHTASP